MIPNIPVAARVFPLTPGTKFPATKHGHHDAQPYIEDLHKGRHQGIALDEQYLVIDFDVDHPERAAFEASLPPTWSQKTGGKSPNGIHYLFTIPEGYTNKNSSFKALDGTRIADIKTRGYIVAPGSIVNGPYESLNDLSPQPVPKEHIIPIAHAKGKTKSKGVGGVANGEHDKFLISLVGWARKNWSLDEEALYNLQLEGPLAVLQDIDSSNPYTETHLRAKARQGASYEPLKPLELVREGWRVVTDTSKSLVKWHIQDFIPKGELVLQYGAGGIGKSTWLSHLAAKAVKRGLKVGVASVEESVERFIVRAHLSSPDLGDELLNIVDIGHEWKFPGDAEIFREELEKYPLDIIYFDSVYAHFENNDKFSNAAEKARACLSPLASIAQELGITIIGTFHQNKAGDYLGSTEMLNVSRVVLHATRVGEGPLKVRVKKTNFNQPDHALNMIGSKMGAESVQGDPWMEETEDGVVSQTQLYVVTEYVKSTGEDETEFTEDMMRDDEYDLILDFLKTNPKASKKRICDSTGLTDMKVRGRLEKIKIYYPELVNTK